MTFKNGILIGNEIYDIDTIRDKISQSEEKVLYFEKNSYFNTLHDCPCKGATKDMLINSYINGPFESKSSPLYKEDMNSVHKKEIIPKLFKEIPEFYEFRITTAEIDKNFDRFARKKLDFFKLNVLGNKLIYNLSGVSNDYEKRNNEHKAIIDNCYVEVNFSEQDYTPDFKVKVYGLKKESKKVLKLLKLEKIFLELESHKFFSEFIKNNKFGLLCDVDINKLNINNYKEKVLEKLII